jgi:hypothetical protein
MPRKMMEGRLFTGRRKGRPHLRRMDNVVLWLRPACCSRDMTMHLISSAFTSSPIPY